jgi:hypothetical protein
MNWEEGRQGTGYFKKRLVETRWPFPFDLYLLKYPEGSSIPEHTDPVAGKRHYRLNIELRRAVGGVFWKRDSKGSFPCHTEHGRIHFFRPDIEPHGLTKVLYNTRYVLSLGFVL